MVQVQKRNGIIVPFDRQRIIDAINKAFIEVDGQLYETDTAEDIADEIRYYVKNSNRVVSVEELQDMIENYLMKSERPDVARAYIRYRYKKEILRQTSKTYDGILELVELANDELKDENSNKNAVIASTQRDYMAGEVSKDLSQRIFLPKSIVDAHNQGIIHFHDMDYYAQHIHNCFGKETAFITSAGVKTFMDFKDGDIIQALGIDGKYHRATVRSYGKQRLNIYTFYNGKHENTYQIRATANHRWILADGTETTNLKRGDKLIKAPVLYNQDLDWKQLSDTCKLMWCKGFGLGDGTIEYGNKDANGRNIQANRTRIRLCGQKDLQYLDRFTIPGCGIRNTQFENNDREVVIYNYHKEIPSFASWEELYCFINGLYCADGNVKKQGKKINFRLQSSHQEIIDFIRQYASVIGLYITKERDLTGKQTNYGVRPYTINFSFNPDFTYHYTVLDIQPDIEEEVWCLEVDDVHNFVLEHGIPTGNCCLVNLEDMLQNGTVINKTLIEKPHSFATACNIATQIMAVVASGQYGGQSITLSHLAPFVDISRQKIREDVIEEIRLAGQDVSDTEVIDKLTERRVKEEIKRGIQTMQYQINTLNTSNGQTPFVTVFMYLNEVPEGQIKTDLAMIIEEVLNQRIQGVKNESGVWITPAFPKLIYVLEEDNIIPESRFWYLTELAAKCTAKRLVPDYISEKIMKQLKLSTGEEPGEGDCYACMGKRKLQLM